MLTRSRAERRRYAVTPTSVIPQRERAIPIVQRGAEGVADPPDDRRLNGVPPMKIAI